MLLHIVAVGRMGRSPEADLVQRYVTRLGSSVRLTEFPEGKAQRLALADGHCRTVVLDEQGQQLSSVTLAEQLRRWREEGVREVRFLIGGADGHTAEVRRSANLMLAMGAMTWPHMLARAMLAEQLYRAHSILAGHPYHREGER